MDPLQEQLLRRLETGEIHREELESFRRGCLDSTVDQELMWILFSVEQLEKHRLRLVQHLRSLRSAA